MKIFSMNDCDWMAAPTLEEAKAAYLKDVYGVNSTNDEGDAFDDPGEISETQYDKLLFHDDDGKVRSFREQLQLMIERGDKFPVLFASTEY